jgi:hypothetical protein
MIFLSPRWRTATTSRGLGPAQWWRGWAQNNNLPLINNSSSPPINTHHSSTTQLSSPPHRSSKHNLHSTFATNRWFVEPEGSTKCRAKRGCGLVPLFFRKRFCMAIINNISLMEKGFCKAGELHY